MTNDAHTTTWYLHIFGDLHLEGAPDPPADINTLTWSILCYVMVHGGEVSREALISQLLPDSYRSTRMVWQALVVLQQWLGADCFVVNRQFVRIAPKVAYTTDVDVYSRLVDGDYSIAQAQIAVALYRPVAFAGTKYPWAYALAMHVEDQYRRALLRIVEYAQQQRNHTFRVYYGKLLAQACPDDISVQLNYVDMLQQLCMDDVAQQHIRNLPRGTRKALRQAMAQHDFMPPLHFLHEEGEAMMDRRMMLVGIVLPSYMGLNDALHRQRLQVGELTAWRMHVPIVDDVVAMRTVTLSVMSFVRAVFLQDVLLVNLTTKHDTPQALMWHIAATMRTDAVFLVRARSAIQQLDRAHPWREILVDVIERSHGLAHFTDVHVQALTWLLNDMHRAAPLWIIIANGNGCCTAETVQTLCAPIIAPVVVVGAVLNVAAPWHVHDIHAQILDDLHYLCALTFGDRAIRGPLLDDLQQHVSTVTQFVQYVALVYHQRQLQWHAEALEWSYESQVVPLLMQDWLQRVDYAYRLPLYVNAVVLRPLRLSEFHAVRFGEEYDKLDMLNSLMWYGLLMQIDGEVHFTSYQIWQTVREQMTPEIETIAYTYLMGATTGVERVQYALLANQLDVVVNEIPQHIEIAWMNRDISVLQDMGMFLESLTTHDQQWLMQMRATVYVYLGGGGASVAELDVYSEAIAMLGYTNPAQRYRCTVLEAHLMRWQGRMRDAAWLLMMIREHDYLAIVPDVTRHQALALLFQTCMELGDVRTLREYLSSFYDSARTTDSVWSTRLPLIGVMLERLDIRPEESFQLHPWESVSEDSEHRQEIDAYWQAWWDFVHVRCSEVPTRLLEKFAQQRVLESTFDINTMVLYMIQQLRFGRLDKAQELAALLEPHLRYNEHYLVAHAYVRYVAAQTALQHNNADEAIAILEHALGIAQTHDLLFLRVIFTGELLRIARVQRLPRQMRAWSQQLTTVHEYVERFHPLRYTHELAWAAWELQQPKQAVAYARTAIAEVNAHSVGVLLPGEVLLSMLTLLKLAGEEVTEVQYEAQREIRTYMRQMADAAQRNAMVAHIEHVAQILEPDKNNDVEQIIWVPARSYEVGEDALRIPVLIPALTPLMGVLDTLDVLAVVYRHIHAQDGVLDVATVQQIVGCSEEYAEQLQRQLFRHLGIPAPTTS